MKSFFCIILNSNFKPNIAFQADDLQTILTVVSSGIGTTLIPSPFVPVKGMIMQEIKGIDLILEGKLAWRSDNSSEVLAKFLKFF